MINLQLVRCFFAVTNFGALIGACPIRYNSSSRQFEAIPSPRLFYAQTLRVALQIAFYIGQLCRLGAARQLDLVSAMLLGAYANMMMTILLLNLNVWVTKDDLADFVTKFLKYYGPKRVHAMKFRAARAKLKYGGNIGAFQEAPDLETSRRLNAIYTGLFTGFTICMTIIMTGFTIMCFVRPRQPTYWISLVLPHFDHWTLRILFVLTEIELYLVVGVDAFFEVAIMVPCLMCVKYDLVRILKTTKRIRTPEAYWKAWRDYACVTLIIKGLTQAFRPVTLRGHQVLIAMMILSGLFTNIQFEQLLFEHPVMYSVFGVLSVTCLVYEMLFLKFTMDLFALAKGCMTIFVRKSFARGRIGSFKNPFRGVPKLVGPFRHLKFVKPPQYLRQIGMTLVKLQVYLNKI